MKKIHLTSKEADLIVEALKAANKFRAERHPTATPLICNHNILTLSDCLEVNDYLTWEFGEEYERRCGSWSTLVFFEEKMVDAGCTALEDMVSPYAENANPFDN
jgi:hypothetical protein